MDKMKRMQELVELLNKAGKAYYQDAQEIMSNYEYDALYDELKGLEEGLVIIRSHGVPKRICDLMDEKGIEYVAVSYTHLTLPTNSRV